MQNIHIQKTQGGFTLIELVIVIVILGILAAVAVPRFIDLSTEAGNAAAEGVAGAISSGSAINFAACKVGATPCTTIDSTTQCTILKDLLEGGSLPADISWTNSTAQVGATGNGCTLQHASGNTPATVSVVLTN